MIKKFEQYNISFRSPIYNKGEILIFSNMYDENMDYNFAKNLIKRAGFEVIGEPYNRVYIVKCEPGKEIECGKIIIEKYPDFFESYEREDIRFDELQDIIDNIVHDVEGIVTFVESSTKKTVNKKEFNDYIDNIINSLNDLKIK